MATAAAAAAAKKVMLRGLSSLAGHRAGSLRGGASSSSLAGLHRAAPSPGARLHSVSFFKEMEDYCHVSGRFEPNSSKFVLLHLNERLNVISVYLRTAKRHWVYAVLNLFGAIMMISPVMLDYYRVSRIEAGLQDLQTEVAQEEDKCQLIHTTLHGV